MVQMTDQKVTERAAALADDLMARGHLRDPAWRQALIEVPRHLFVPQTARAMPDISDGEPYLIDAQERPAQWWDAVYSDTAIVTQLDDGASGPAAETGIPTSSISAPAVVAAFLELLDVRDHDRVLEIGTGTGFTAALLSHRLGSGNVTSIEVDKDVAAQAQANLKAAGYEPWLVVGDGEIGWPGEAPYDRIHLTCAVERVPAALIEQTRPGGSIVLPWSPAPHTGYMVRLDVLGDGVAVGRILGSAAYMMMRSQRRDLTWNAHHSDQAKHTVTQIDPRTITQGGPAADLAILSLVPGLNCRPVTHPDTGEFELLLWDVDNISWAECDYEPGKTVYDVYSYGPRHLWDEVCRAHLHWLSLGRPGIDRFGLTIGPGEQHRLWLDHPDHVLTPWQATNIG